MAERDGGAGRPLLDITGAVLASVLAFAAVPTALVLVVGNPLTTGLGHAWPALPRDTMCALALAAWVAWVACCAQVVRTVVVHVRRRDGHVAADATLVERVATRIAVGVLALMGLGSPATLQSIAGASPPYGTAARVVSPAEGTGGGVPVPLGRSEPGTAGTVVDSPPSYAVRPGDTLWKIADTTLGDGADWTAIARLNFGCPMADGTTLVDPDHLREGWNLALPAGNHRERHAARRDRPPGTSGTTQGGPSGHLPELLALGMGSLACAALARQAARRRARSFPEALALPDLSDEALDVATLVQRFDGVPALGAFETANTLLGEALDGRARRPSVRAICVGPSGVTFHLAQPDDAPPERFSAHPDGSAWHVEHAALGPGQRSRSSPYAPLALPVGDDAEGTWLIALQPGSVLPLLGESAPALWRSARAALGAWAWSDTVHVAEEAGDPVLHREAAGPPGICRHLVYFGNPGDLPATVASRVAVVTSSPAAASDLSVLVDRHAATLHPLGRVLRPHLQTAETALALDELAVEGPTTARTPRPIPARPGTPSVVGAARTAGADGGGDGGARPPGPVDVRLLTATPRLDGLREELPPNRARRAVELVAYLALHQPDVVTSDRLRTRVLGSSDADAAAKTLFNTAHAARRAMGNGTRGELLFPAASRNGLYQLSSEVTVDVHRAAVLAADAARHAETDADLALAHLRAALELVEGEPLANVLGGYSWWEAEGHGGHIAAVLVDAACTLAGQAAARDRYELAWWGLGRARLVAPYSEALSRAAMRTAAAEGDADRLRLEWRECQRLVDALDPGSMPSPRTESLYGELSRRVVGAAVGAYAPSGDWSPVSEV